jgi:hypothetical protein
MKNMMIADDLSLPSNKHADLQTMLSVRRKQVSHRQHTEVRGNVL